MYLNSVLWGIFPRRYTWKHGYLSYIFKGIVMLWTDCFCVPLFSNPYAGTPPLNRMVVGEGAYGKKLVMTIEVTWDYGFVSNDWKSLLLFLSQHVSIPREGGCLQTRSQFLPDPGYIVGTLIWNFSANKHMRNAFWLCTFSQTVCLLVYC